MRIGLFFGSFNPIHSGHLLIANYMVDFTDMDKIWFVISPQNPFKVNDDLLDEKQRLNLLKLAIEDDKRFEACDIEFSLERPSYTIHTLNHLSNLYPE
jgi:nicotinate-nucleotide adenylyltransferase